MGGRLNCPPWHCRHPSQEVKNRLFCQSFLSGGFFPQLLVESFFQIAKSIPRYGKQIRVCLQIKSSETVKPLIIKPCWPRGEFSVEGEGGEGKGYTINVIYNRGQGRLHCLIIILCRPLPIKGVAFTMQPPPLFFFLSVIFWHAPVASR